MGKITYYRLFDKLNRLDIKQKDLKEKKIVSAGTLDKLRRNDCVNTDTLIKLCDFLHCDLSDICEYETDQDN